jgi:hypothetical protein
MAHPVDRREARMNVRSVAAGALLLALAPATALAQGYTLRLDGGIQGVSFRGYSADSIPVDSVVTGSTGGLETPSGYAVSCTSNAPYCMFWIPGPIRSTTPAVAQAALSMWGLGLTGLRVQVNTYATTDFNTGASWPGTSPNLQLIEGYLEYAAPYWTAVAGRKIVSGRLGTYGFDGGQLTGRLPSAGLQLSGYLGVGLAMGTNLPITADALDPQQEYRPAQSPLVAGLLGSWVSPHAELAAEYRREVDQTTDYFASERVAGSATLRPFGAFSLVGGAIYDMATGLWGSADASVRYTVPKVGVVAGYRRYAPFFELWTVWGAFSPVPYNAWYGSASVQPTRQLQLRVRGESYQFESTETESPLVTLEDAGWRGSAGATYQFTPAWQAQIGYHEEFGPGASSNGWDGSITFAPGSRSSIMVYGNSLYRPLEYRWDDSRVLVYGMQASVVARDNLTVAFMVARYDENRERPDAASFEWDQLRFGAKAVLTLSSADRMPLPKAITNRPAGY